MRVRNQRVLIFTAAALTMGAVWLWGQEKSAVFRSKVDLVVLSFTVDALPQGISLGKIAHARRRS